MQQTPPHDQHNPDLLRIIPTDCKKIIEVGCSSGALAREYKKINPECDYYGVEIDASYCEMARVYCDRCACLDIELATQDFWETQSDRDCWVFGDTLEHLKNPEAVLQKIATLMATQKYGPGYIAACIPNMQHWSIQARLNIGDLRYQSSGLLDRTHLRWFTRQTMIELFSNSGFDIISGIPRVFNEPLREKYLPLIGSLAKVSGYDPNQAINDSIPLQWVFLARSKIRNERP